MNILQCKKLGIPTVDITMVKEADDIPVSENYILLACDSDFEVCEEIGCYTDRDLCIAAYRQISSDISVAVESYNGTSEFNSVSLSAELPRTYLTGINVIVKYLKEYLGDSADLTLEYTDDFRIVRVIDNKSK